MNNNKLLYDLQKRLTSTRKFFNLFLFFLFTEEKSNQAAFFCSTQQNCMTNLNSLWLDFGCEMFLDNGKCDCTFKGLEQRKCV